MKAKMIIRCPLHERLDNMKKSQFKFSKPIVEDLKYTLRNDWDISKYHNKTAFNVGVDVDKEDNGNTAIVRLVLKIDSEDFPYNIDMTAGTKVTWNSDISEKMLDSVLENNIPATLLSYVRPLVSVITSYSPYNQLDIPLLDFRSDQDDDNQQTN